MTVRLIRTGTRGSSSWPGEQSPTRGRIHLRRLYFVQKSLLAVERRTIHSGKLEIVLALGAEWGRVTVDS